MADTDPGLVAVLAVSMFFVAWYFVGSALNRRLARRLSNELRDSVLKLGGQSRVQWLGSTAFRMTTTGADRPFRDVSLIVTLRPREMPLNWAAGIASGRRDAAVFEATLRGRPTTDLELVDPSSPVGRRRAASATAFRPWSFRGRNYLLASDDPDAARALLERLPPDVGEFAALSVSTGEHEGLAASVSLVPGRVGKTVEAMRSLAAAATGQ